MALPEAPIFRQCNKHLNSPVHFNITKNVEPPSPGQRF